MNMIKDEFFKLSQQTTRGHPLKLYKQHATKLTRINTFSNRIINDWNGLTSEIVTATSTNLFKNKLDKQWKGGIFDAPFSTLILRVGTYRRMSFFFNRNILLLSLYINRIRMFVCLYVCLFAANTRLIEPRSTHVFYMGRSAIYRARSLSKNQLDPDNASSFMSENVRNSHIFLQFLLLSAVAYNGIPNDMYPIIYLYYRIPNDIYLIIYL